MPKVRAKKIFSRMKTNFFFKRITIGFGAQMGKTLYIDEHIKTYVINPSSFQQRLGIIIGWRHSVMVLEIFKTTIYSYNSGTVRS